MVEKERTVTPNPSPGPQNAQTPKRTRIWPWIAGAFLLLIIGIWFLTHGRSAGQASRPGRGGMNAPVVVGTVTPQKGSMGVYVEALGTVTPVYTVSVAARVAGQITKVNYQEGQQVHVGDPLVEIDPRPYQAAVLQAQGQLAHDTALLEDAKLDLDRYREAFESNAIPKQQYDTQLATVHQYEGSVQLDQGNLDSANVNLTYCNITSPIDGHVGLRLVDPGNIVQANGTAPLVIIAQLQPITVIFNVAEDDLSKILPAVRKNPHLPIDIYDREDQTKIASGKLDTLDNQINTSTGTLRLRGVFSNEDESLFPNQFVNVHLLVNTLNDITLLPNSAIQRNSESAYVYLVKAPEEGQTNHTVQLQNITVGITDGTNSQVEGVSEDAVLAADNFNRLTDGSKIMIRPAGGSGQEQGQEEGQSKGKGKRHKKDSQ
jgi:membrane fusion protein, multidrug efflux system